PPRAPRRGRRRPAGRGGRPARGVPRRHDAPAPPPRRRARRRRAGRGARRGARLLPPRRGEAAVSVATAAFPAAAPARPATNKWLVTVSVSFGTLMGAIDTSIVNVALPHIRGAV